MKILEIVLSLPEIKLPVKKGKPFFYSPKVVTCCFVVMVAKRLSVRGLHALLVCSNDPLIIAIKETIPFPDNKIPDRRTFDRRLKNCQYIIQLFMISLVDLFVRRFKVGIARLAMDNRMFSACGAIWHRKDQLQAIIPNKLRNVDTTAGWGISAYRGWIFGHGLDVIVTVGKIVIPIVANGRSLVHRGNKCVNNIIRMLPKVKKGVISADSEYYDQKLKMIAKGTGRSIHAPSKREPAKVPQSKTYDRRKKKVEPYFERFLLAYQARGKLTRKGEAAQSCLTICCFLYQLMVYHNLCERVKNPMQVTHQYCLL